MTPLTRMWLKALLLCAVAVGVCAQSSCSWPASFVGGPAAGVTWSAFPVAPSPDACIAVSPMADLSRGSYRARTGLVVSQSSGCGGGLCDSPSSPTTHSSLASIVCPAGWFGSAQAQCEATRMCERARCTEHRRSSLHPPLPSAAAARKTTAPAATRTAGASPALSFPSPASRASRQASPLHLGPQATRFAPRAALAARRLPMRALLRGRRRGLTASRRTRTSATRVSGCTCVGECAGIVDLLPPPLPRRVPCVAHGADVRPRDWCHGGRRRAVRGLQRRARHTIRHGGIGGLGGRRSHVLVSVPARALRADDAGAQLLGCGSDISHHHPLLPDAAHLRRQHGLCDRRLGRRDADSLVHRLQPRRRRAAKLRRCGGRRVDPRRRRVRIHVRPGLLRPARDGPLQRDCSVGSLGVPGASCELPAVRPHERADKRRGTGRRRRAPRQRRLGGDVDLRLPLRCWNVGPRSAVDLRLDERRVGRRAPLLRKLRGEPLSGRPCDGRVHRPDCRCVHGERDEGRGYV